MIIMLHSLPLMTATKFREDIEKTILLLIPNQETMVEKLLL